MNLTELQAFYYGLAGAGKEEATPVERFNALGDAVKMLEAVERLARECVDDSDEDLGNEANATQTGIGVAILAILEAVMTEPLSMKQTEGGHWEKDFGSVQQHTPNDCPKCFLATLDARDKQIRQLEGRACLLCGRDEPCELDTNKDNDPNWPGSPCTFDPSPIDAARRFWEKYLTEREERVARDKQNEALGEQLAEAEVQREPSDRHAANLNQERIALEWLVEGYRQRLTEAKERKVVLTGMTQEQKAAVFFIKACVTDALRFTVADYPGGEKDG